VGDVAQAGAPVASDMMAMNALRAFAPEEVDQMGGTSAFAPVTWQSTQQISEQQIWSVPWMTDPRIFLYWRDLLEQAGVDEDVVITKPDSLLDGLKRIRAGVIPHPWGITAGHKHSAIHTVSSWVWATGGDFTFADGNRALFLEPEALAGLKAYFSTIEFMAPESQSADYRANNLLFANRQLF
jgi:ABC-type glycerol-3-phosphate transport system substrate-binding protein